VVYSIKELLDIHIHHIVKLIANIIYKKMLKCQEFGFGHNGLVKLFQSIMTTTIMVKPIGYI